MNVIKFPNVRIEQLISNALLEANALGHTWIGSEHVLLAYYSATDAYTAYTQIQKRIKQLYGNGTPLGDTVEVYDMSQQRKLTFEERITDELERAINCSDTNITDKEFIHNFLKDVTSTAYEVVINIENPVIDYFKIASKYVAKDGKVFDNETDCLFHNWELRTRAMEETIQTCSKEDITGFTKIMTIIKSCCNMEFGCGGCIFRDKDNNYNQCILHTLPEHWDIQTITTILDNNKE